MDSYFSRLARPRNAALFLALLGAALFLPALGSFGLWDPYEVRVADLAKEMSTAAGWKLPARSGSLRPPLNLWLIASGFKVMDLGELAGRLPIALTALGALLASYWAGLGLVRRRGALFATVALVTMPAFFLGARQLVTAVPLVLGAALAIGGFARALGPARDDEGMSGRVLGALAGGSGLVIGYLAAGALVGVAVPAAAIGIALLVARRPGGAVTFGLGAAALVGAGVIAYLASRVKQGQYSPILGGFPRSPTHLVTYTSVIKDLGFAAFPWVALLPLGLARPPRTDEDARERFGRVLAIAWAGAGYVMATLFTAWSAEIVFPALGAVALVAGDYLDGVLDDERRLGLAGFVAIIGAAVLAHDIVEAPELFGGAHIAEGIKWPSPVTLPRYFILAVGITWGLLVGVGLALRPATANDASVVGKRQFLVGLGLGITILTAFGSVYAMVPTLSKHLSSKGLFSRYQALGGADGELCQYRASGKGIDYYFKGKGCDLTTLEQMFGFFMKPNRVFVVTPVEELAPIDQFAKANGRAQAYAVIDDSNSRFLLLSNKLGKGEKDLNPLRRLIVSQLPRPPQHEVHADYEGKVELVGYDLPSEVERGQRFTITLYYKVKAPLAAGWKVFVHYDGPGHRFNGDHVPLDGKFPTNYWVPGFYIIDEHPMEADRSLTPAGNYQIYTGFWQGGDRLKVVGTQHDGENRVKIGSVRVR